MVNRDIEVRMHTSSTIGLGEDRLKRRIGKSQVDQEKEEIYILGTNKGEHN